LKQHHATRLRFSTTAIVAVVSALLSLFLVIPAAAHAGLKSSDPADGATLTAWPASVTFTFWNPSRKSPQKSRSLGPTVR
jgi:methionine-rich copper-binding protein CopC